MPNLFCLVCNKSFPETELSGHVASVHLGFLPFACTCCEFIAAQESDVLRHADKEGHIPFVADRTNVKPYLSLLTSLIVGHCQTFAESKNFTEILSGLTSQIAANKNGLVRLKCQMQIEPNRDADVSSERSSSTLRSALIANSLAVNSPASITDTSSLDFADSKPANQHSSVQTTTDVTQHNKADTTPKANGWEGQAVGHDGQEVNANATEMCALCVSDEVFQAEQKEGHVIRHVERSGTSANQNPAVFFTLISEMWQRCFPSQTLPNDDVAMETKDGLSSERNQTQKPKPPIGHTVCTLCEKCVRISAKKKHVWQEHMDGADRFSCGSCANKGLVKGALEQACADLHPDIPADIKPSSSSSQVFDEQFELCFGHLPRRVGRPARRYLSGATPDIAVAARKPIDDTASSKTNGSSERRYPLTRRSLNTQMVDTTDVSSQSIIPGRANCRLSPMVHSEVLTRPRSRDPSGRVNRSLSPAGAAWKALKRLRTKRGESSSYTVPDVAVPDSRIAESVRDKITKGRPQKHETRCGLCQNRIHTVGYASHVWTRHMSGSQRLTCEVCASKHNFLPSLHAECIVRHPESKPIIKMDQSRELRRKYEQRYLQCFAVRPRTCSGFFKSAKPTWSGLGGASGRVSSMPNVNLVKAAAKRVAKGSAVKCQLCSRCFKYGLKRHALRKHFGCVVFECSECGYGDKANAYKVSDHARLAHPDDASVRVVDHSAKYSRQIQQCLDSCFPNLGHSAKGRRKRENESSPLLSEATIEVNSAEFDQPGTSGYAAIEVGEDAEEMEQSSGFASDCDDENEASLSLVKQELLLQGGHMKNVVVVISSADVAAALKNVAVKTEKIDDD